MQHRIKFLSQIVILMMLMIGVSLAIKANYYSQLLTWGLFTYIIIKEVMDYYRDVAKRRKCVRWPITFYYQTFKIKGDNMNFALALGYVLPFQVGKPIDSEGNERSIEEGSLSITSTDETVFTIEQDDQFPDNPDAKIIVPHAVGSADLVVSADADLGEGVTTITATANGTVTETQAVGFAPFTFGQPRPKTPTA